MYKQLIITTTTRKAWNRMVSLTSKCGMGHMACGPYHMAITFSHLLTRRSESYCELSAPRVLSWDHRFVPKIANILTPLFELLKATDAKKTLKIKLARCMSFKPFQEINNKSNNNSDQYTRKEYLRNLTVTEAVAPV